MTESSDDELGPEDRISAASLRERRRTRRMRRALRVPVDEVPRPAGAPAHEPPRAEAASPAERPERTSVVAARIVTIGVAAHAPPPPPVPRMPLTESGDELDVELDVEPLGTPAPAPPPPLAAAAPPARPQVGRPDARASREALPPPPRDESMRSIEVPLDADEIDTIPPAPDAEPKAAVIAPPPPALPSPIEDEPLTDAALELEAGRPSTPDLTDAVLEDEGKLTPIPESLEFRARPLTPPPPPRPPSIPPPAPVASPPSRGSVPPPPPPAFVAAAVPVLPELLLGEPPVAVSPIAPSTASLAQPAPPAPAAAPIPVTAAPAVAPPSAAPTPTVSTPAQATPAPAASSPAVLSPSQHAASSYMESREQADSLPDAGVHGDGIDAEESPTVRRKRKKRHKPWWDEFFNDDYLRTFAPPTPDQTRRQVDFVDDSLGLSPGANVLDLACGLGRHAVEMAARGYKVVGLDLSIPMLATAGELAQERGVKINFIHGDMREMVFDGNFDGVYCFETSFGFFDDEVNREVLARVHRALKPMGMFLLDVVNRDFVMRQQPNLVWFEGDGCVCMEESDMNYITSRLHVKRTLILEDGRQKQSEYSIRLYSLHELGQLLHNLGFRVAEVSGRLTTPGVFFGAESPRLIILAEKRAPAELAANGPSTGQAPGLAATLTPTNTPVVAPAAPEAPPADRES